jgi:hypothetical protein
MSSIVEEFLRRGYGLPNRAAADLARALMQGDPATFKAGYSRASAIAAALEMFPQADRDAVEKLVAP